MSPPAYQSLEGQDVELVSSQDGGALIRVLAGRNRRTRRPGKIANAHDNRPHHTWRPVPQFRFPGTPCSSNALAYVLAGQGAVG
jgi:hypothetical protein